MMHLYCQLGKIHVIIRIGMTQRSLLLTAAACLALSILFPTAGNAATAEQESIKQDLETVYNTWRQSMLRGNYEGWLANTSAHRKARVRNLAVSEKKQFPKSLFKEDMAPPSIMPLRYIGSVIKGPTAAATYFGKIDWGIGGAPSENAYVLLFTKEGGQWKYDQARFFNLAHLPKVRDALRNGDRSILNEQDGFQPEGKIPAVPPLCPAPQYISKIYVDCPGRSVDIVVNNISAHHFEDMRYAEIISGGTHDGTNTINLQFQDMPDRKKGPLDIRIFIMPETPGNVPGKAFEYILPEDQNPVSGPTTFTITPDVIRKMSEKRIEEEKSGKKKQAPARK